MSARARLPPRETSGAARLLGLALAAVLLAGGAGCLHPPRGTPDAPIVTAFELPGVKAFDPGAIRARLATQPPGDLHLAFGGPGPTVPVIRTGLVRDTFALDLDALSVDRRRVEAFYRERGYYEVHADDPEIVPAGAGRVRVVMRVHEGSPVRVTKLTVEGLDAAPEAQARVEKLPLKVGDVFAEGPYDATRSAILTALKDTGYATAEVTQSAHVLPAAGSAEVSYVVKAGRRYRFGPVFVAGTAAVSRDRVREEVTRDVQPGDVYDEQKLARAQARVFGLGVFGGVRVTRGTPDPARDVVPIVVAVREAPFHTIRLGPGVGIEASRWDVHAVAGWTNRNWLGDLRRLSLEARFGYAWLPNVWAPRRQSPVGIVTAEFSQPGAITRYVDITTALTVERGIEDAYDFWSERGRLGFPLRITPRVTLVPSYNLEVYQLFNTGGVLIPGTPPGQTTGPQLEACKNNVCLLSYLEQRIAWDGRDNIMYSRRGVYLSLALQEGFNFGTYGYRYLRFLPEARGFVPIGQRMVLAARLRLGGLIPVSENMQPPIVARFTAGGPLSMRGYYSRRLSPMVLQGTDWVPVGGNGVADGSLELRFDVSSVVGAAVFLDAGFVSRPSAVPTAYRDAFRLANWQPAFGFGIRYRTPVGPLRVDVAARLPTNFAPGVSFPHRFPPVPSVENAGVVTDEAGNVIQVIPNEHREPIIAIHLTLGEAF